MRILSAVRSWRCSFWSLRAALVWQVSTHTAWPWPAWRGYGEGNPARDHATTMKKGWASDISGGYCVGVPPLPIPNREVKPVCADGTAMQCGRVGGRLFLSGDCSPMRAAVSFSFCAFASRRPDILENAEIPEFPESSAKQESARLFPILPIANLHFLVTKTENGVM